MLLVIACFRGALLPSPCFRPHRQLQKALRVDIFNRKSSTVLNYCFILALIQPLAARLAVSCVFIHHGWISQLPLAHPSQTSPSHHSAALTAKHTPRTHTNTPNTVHTPAQTTSTSHTSRFNCGFLFLFLPQSAARPPTLANTKEN